jgi:hypothetical protein
LKHTRLIDGLVGIERFAYDFEVGLILEDPAQTFAEAGMIVNDEAAYRHGLRLDEVLALGLPIRNAVTYRIQS